MKSLKTIHSTSITPKVHGTYKHVREGEDMLTSWSNVVQEPGEPGQSNQPWMGDHYGNPSTCLYSDLNPGHSGDKRMFYHCAILIAKTNQLSLLQPQPR